MTDQDDAMVSIENLGVRFGPIQALKDIDLRLGAGERLALLGHNGAGKSTLFRAILGFITPASGRITVAGCAPGTHKARDGLAYLPEAIAFPKSLTGREIIAFYARLKGADPRMAEKLLERVGLAEAARRQVGTYSKGMRQRLGLAQALIGQPRVLLLDEPTSGLDPLSRRDLYAIVNEVVREGTAVLHSSHSLSELEGHTDRIAILSKGRLVAVGPLSELAQQARLPIRVRIKAHQGMAEKVQAAIGGDRLNGQLVVVSCQPEDKLSVLARLAGLAGAVQDFDFETPTLDDVYQYFSDRPNMEARQ